MTDEFKVSVSFFSFIFVMQVKGINDFLLRHEVCVSFGEDTGWNEFIPGF